MILLMDSPKNNKIKRELYLHVIYIFQYGFHSKMSFAWTFFWKASMCMGPNKVVKTAIERFL